MRTVSETKATPRPLLGILAALWLLAPAPADGADCESQYVKAVATCKRLRKPDAVKNRCYASAMERKVQCERGKYVPSLVKE